MNPLRNIVSAIAGLGLAMLAACASSPQMGATNISSSATSYRLGSGDELKITVFGEPDLSGLYVVDGEGQLTLPLVGQVEVATLPLPDASTHLENKLKDGYLRDPKVTIELVKGRPYYILGEVNKPGEYPFVSGLTMMNAIASAGDFTYRADRVRILVKRSDSPSEAEVELKPNTPVQPGDTIRIRERFF
jgi:protein involved in polysaccharide export with SLBB domain